MAQSGFDRRILGIDPGTNFLGYAVIAIPEGSKKPQLIVSGVVDLKKITDPYLKLQKIFNRVQQVIDEYLPDELVGTHYYQYGNNKLEQAAKQYWQTIKKEG